MDSHIFKKNLKIKILFVFLIGLSVLLFLFWYTNTYIYKSKAANPEITIALSAPDVVNVGDEFKVLLEIHGKATGLDLYMSYDPEVMAYFKDWDTDPTHTGVTSLDVGADKAFFTAPPMIENIQTENDKQKLHLGLVSTSSSLSPTVHHITLTFKALNVSNQTIIEVDATKPYEFVGEEVGGVPVQFDLSSSSNLSVQIGINTSTVTTTPTLLPPPGVTLPSPLPVCGPDGWDATLTWIKPDFPVNPIKNFILRINMINKWMETKPTDLSIENIIAWTQWYLADGSDTYLITPDSHKVVSVIPFRPYYDWSVQSISADEQKGPTVAGSTFTCAPTYTMVESDRSSSCFDSNGNIIEECSIERFTTEYRQQYGYASSPTMGDTRMNFNYITGKNAYKYDTVMNGGTEKELIDLLDFEAWRKFKHTAPATPTIPANSIIGISVSESYSCAMRNDNAVECWGGNDLGQLGNGTDTAINTPVIVDTKEKRLKSISLGKSHSCGITSTGGVNCWGANGFGQLGIATPNPSTPVDVTGLGTDAIQSVVVGSNHSCAVTNNGAIKCWGANSFGQLGNGKKADSISNPIDVVGLTSGVTNIALATSHSCALTSQGEAQCWGNNQYGQLGNNTTIDSAIPVAVTGLSNVKNISTIGNSICALTNAGSVYCWGNNSSGQLGDGTKSDKHAPVAVTGLTNVASIAMGYQHTCALLSDSSVKCWGKNNMGQLGDNTTIDSAIPVAVTGLTNVASIAMGYQHTCALLSDSSVKCWGNNTAGQLGNGTTTNSNIPVDVTGLARGVDSMFSGLSHSCVRTTERSVKCWGSNTAGQLGNGTTTNSNIPVDILFN